mmetsp:Transcript_18431/g.46039  ORF Transcript_18431/g.46039 Transcript_18431/m.46039 type:complete len:132 (+) Transcript_18431:230-625(+)
MSVETFFVQNPNGQIGCIAGADAIEPPPANPRITCHHCRTLLEYPDGSSYVQCFVCSAMNAVVNTDTAAEGEDYPIGGRTINMLCAVCGTSNLAPWGTHYVRCGSCGTVSDVSHIYHRASQQRRQSQSGVG